MTTSGKTYRLPPTPLGLLFPTTTTPKAGA